MGEEGLEPSRPAGHNILSVARMPIPPLAQEYSKVKIMEAACGDFLSSLLLDFNYNKIKMFLCQLKTKKSI